MLNSKKLLIISCSTGSGHLRAAEALRLTCDKLYPNVEVLHIDMADYLDGISRIYLVSFYNLFSNLIPFSYKLLYYLTNSWLAQIVFRAVSPIIRIGSRKLIKKIEEYKPDLIISTHFLPSLILPNKISTPIDTVITDYHAHKIWLTPKNRNFFVATEEIKIELGKFHIQSTVSGIPIHPNFFEQKDISKLRDKFNIKNNNPIILFMPTSRGKVSPALAINKILNHNFGTALNIVAIAGKNKKRNLDDLEQFKTVEHTNFTIFENVENIDELMKISDIIVGKAGGLTVSEALFLQKPIIIINPIPGQEDYNTSNLEKNHFGLSAKSDNDLVKKIQYILSNPTSINKKSYPDPSKIILDKALMI
ncbi:MAG: hypothetical protein A2534_00465 [Candidatus Magasanikbacteria bacterium RIFOXYD2_FULL_39_9]|nr:MAG: hypothetical protein A2534_00465 [Candidatus Magasanikbacteria bacterium RIFOXYD2_FULL_39_9]